MNKSSKEDKCFASYASRVPRKQEKDSGGKTSESSKWRSDAKKSFSFESAKSGKYGFIKSVK